MWTNTRMIVLTAVVAALYVCILIPFKVVPIIPGWTDFRPGVMVPLLGSLLFGPAAAWGAAMGNVVGDFLSGMFGWGMIFGFVGNFLLGFLPYKMLESLTRKSVADTGYFAKVLVGVVASLACASIIGWGVDLLGFVQFPALAGAISINNSCFSILYPALFLTLYPRIKRMGLLYTQVMPAREVSTSAASHVLGLALVVIGAVGALTLGLLLYLAGTGEAVKYFLLPFIGAVLVGSLML